MLDQALSGNISNLMTDLGDIGVFIAMFLESSIVPLPSEVIVIGAGAIGIPLVSIVVFGSLGSTLGALFGYFLGRYAALPVILKFGKFILIKPHHIHKAEVFAKKYGAWGVLFGRMIPIVPFKVFSIAAGITNLSPIPFIICTFIGVIPRIYILAIFGSIIMQYKKPALLALLCLVLILLAIKITRMIYNGQMKSKLTERKRS